MGDGSDGLILRERWLPREGLLERLRRSAIACGLHGPAALEAEVTLKRFAPERRIGRRSSRMDERGND